MSTPTAAAIVPARVGSTRLPGKLLADLHGIPVLVHTVRAAQAALGEDHVWVATADEAVVEVAACWGIAVLRSSAEPTCGTDRVAEVVHQLGDYTVVVNVQGDQPHVRPHTIRACADAVTDTTDLATAVCPITRQEWARPSVVKALVDRTLTARWFTRAPVPHRGLHSEDDLLTELLGDEGFSSVRRHLGVYAFRRDAIERWPTLPPSPLARLAGLEQLRAVEAGWTIRAVPVPRPLGPAVDTPEDLAALQALSAPCSQR